MKATGIRIFWDEYELTSSECVLTKRLPVSKAWVKLPSFEFPYITENDIQRAKDLLNKYYSECFKEV